MQLGKTIFRPILTEKSVALTGKDKYAFQVNLKASKNAVAKAVEKMFSVEVIDVKTMIMPGKKRRIGRTNLFSKTGKWKKAIVELKEGQSIDLFEND